MYMHMSVLELCPALDTQEHSHRAGDCVGKTPETLVFFSGDLGLVFSLVDFILYHHVHLAVGSFPLDSRSLIFPPFLRRK